MVVPPPTATPQPHEDVAVAYASPLAVSVIAKKGAIVRSGRDKATSWVMKLLPGMEALAVGEALEPCEGSVRVKLIEPCVGWATLKMLKPFRDDASWGSSAGAGAAPRERATAALLRRLAPPPPVAPGACDARPVPWRFPAPPPGEAPPPPPPPTFRVAARERSNDASDPDRLSPIWAVETPLLAAHRGGGRAAAEVEGTAARGVAGAVSPAEAAALVAAADAMGFDDARNAAVRRNDMCACIVSDADAAELSRRVERACPDSVETRDGGRVGPKAGVNRRWRIYRYRGDARFLPHFDAAWPAAGIDDVGGGGVVHDVGGDSLSWYTLLLYLNDGFSGGATRLFAPGGSVDVVPETGAALLFPHGHHPDSIFHEGVPLCDCDAVKYVLRTDVLYRSAYHEGEPPPPPRAGPA